MTRTSDADTERWPAPEDTLVGRGAPPPAGYYPPPPPPAPDNRLGAGMLIGIITALLVAAGIAVAWFLTHRDQKTQVTTVLVSTPAPSTTQSVPTTTTRAKTKPVAVKKVAMPRVIGMPVADAAAVFKRLHLKPTVTQVSSKEKAGSVVGQAPKAGSKIATGSVVTLAVAKAAHPRSTTAKATTTKATTTTTQAATTTPATTTQPAPTTTAPAPPPQPTTATVPDVSGQTEAEAAQAMNSAGILPSLFFVPSDDPLGTVEQQAKPAGTKLSYHAHVQINISTGPGDKPKEQVPNVIGKTLQDAVSSLNAAHLRLIFVKLPVPTMSQAGKIVQQSPFGGAQAPQNAQVLVFLGAYRG